MLFGAPGLEVTRWGTVKVNHRTMMSKLDGVFAAGDIVRGASLVVWAVRDGRDVAESIHKHITARLAGESAEQPADVKKAGGKPLAMAS